MSSPTIANCTEHTIVVFQERGVFYNKQILYPGEAVSIAKKQTPSDILPYYIHAAIGDEQALPCRTKSLQNLASVAVVPTAFCVGALATAVSAGTLSGPSAALAPLVSGCVVRGVVFDSAAIAAGTLIASRVAVVSEFIVKNNPTKFMAKSKRLFPGRRFVTITGGLEDDLLINHSVDESEFKKIKIHAFKAPIIDESKVKIRKIRLPGRRSNAKKEASRE